MGNEEPWETEKYEKGGNISHITRGKRSKSAKAQNIYCLLIHHLSSEEKTKE